MIMHPAMRAVLLTICLAAPGLAGAQTAPKNTRVAPAENVAPAGPAWTLNCSNQGKDGALACAMSQTVIARQTNQRVLSAAIFRDPQTSGLKLRLALPHGIDLPAGITLSIDDGKPVRSPIRTADQNGSYATLDLGKDLVAAMKAGQLINVGITANGGGAITLQLSLKDFSVAIDRV